MGLQHSADTNVLDPRDTKAALWVSVQSVAWTVLSSAAAITLGIQQNSAVLVSFGAVGCVDAIGSVALVYHFHHSLRHERISEELEQFAHRAVLIGLAAVGGASVIGGIIRLATGQSGEGSVAGMVVAAISMVGLTVLSTRKRSIALRVSSAALLSDAHLSAVGAAQASVALLGTALTRWFGWHWADALAMTVLGCIAVTLSVRTWTAEKHS